MTNKKQLDFKLGDSVKKLLPLIMLLVIGAIISAIQPAFATWTNLTNIMMNYAGTAFVALGAMMVIITGGIDFTSAEVYSCGSVIGGILYLRSGGQPILLLLGCLMVGIGVGVVNGLLIAHLKFPSFIATLAMQSLVHGLMLFFAEGQIIQLEGPVIEFLGKGRLLGIPVAFVMLILFGIVLWFVMNRTRFGTYTYALGGNADALAYTGVNLKKYTVLVYAAAGLCSALGTILITCRMSAIYSSTSSTLLVDGIASTVIGGTATSGGKGTVFGTIAGAMIIGTIGASMTILSVPVKMQNVVKGLIIIAALLVDVLINRRNARA
ncbi:MAG TPA: ABC transporter permease [Candidatus Avoscillospira avicola]|uniref:ABC transporter permease n=1 Tax=Candidatus Avoscillospira avicola TaxID=2840706 RepID=A0A9D1DH39_9FIRM|nr:ABC transporter permease [Candidatus Avoscillospira avicola]